MQSRQKAIPGAAERVAILCPKCRKRLADIDATSLTVLVLCAGGLYLWCRGCHMEHLRLWADIIREQVKRPPR